MNGGHVDNDGVGVESIGDDPIVDNDVDVDDGVGHIMVLDMSMRGLMMMSMMSMCG